MLAAYHLAKDALREFSGKFSRRDFTLPQLFARPLGDVPLHRRRDGGSRFGRGNGSKRNIQQACQEGLGQAVSAAHRPQTADVRRRVDSPRRGQLALPGF